MTEISPLSSPIVSNPPLICLTPPSDDFTLKSLLKTNSGPYVKKSVNSFKSRLLPDITSASNNTSINHVTDLSAGFNNTKACQLPSMETKSPSNPSQEVLVVKRTRHHTRQQHQHNIQTMLTLQLPSIHSESSVLNMTDLDDVYPVSVAHLHSRCHKNMPTLSNNRTVTGQEYAWLAPGTDSSSSSSIDSSPMHQKYLLRLRL